MVAFLRKLVAFLRKLFLVDLIASIFKSGRAPHLRFAGFIELFSYMWLLIMLASAVTVVHSFFNNATLVFIVYQLIWVVLCIGFFFFYLKTAQLLRSYNDEQAARLRYLKYINPIAPIVYSTTLFLVVLAIVNIVMFIALAIGALLFIMIVLVTLGLILFDKDFKLENFIGIPQGFFNTEEYIIDHYISSVAVVVFLFSIYFIIPFCSSMIIHLNHKEALREE